MSKIKDVTMSQASLIEKDIQDLIQELTIRSQKHKLIQICDNFKLLIKKVENERMSYSHGMTQSMTLNNSALILDHKNKLFDKPDSKISNKALSPIDNEYARLKEEIKVLKQSSITLKDLKKDNEINELQSQLSSLAETLNMEKLINKDLIVKIQQQDQENNQLLASIEHIKSNYRNAHNNIDKNYNNIREQYDRLKSKYDELVKVNIELKDKIIEREVYTDQISKELNIEYKKQHKLDDKITYLENSITELTSEIDNKDIRLKALREMNSKLLSKSTQILKKWEVVQSIDKKTEETYTNYKKQLQYYEEMNKKIITLRSDNESYAKYEAQQKKELHNLKDENRVLKKQISEIKTNNEELNKKIDAYESKFKSNLYANTITVEKPSSNLLVHSSFHPKPINSSTYNNCVTLNTNNQYSEDETRRVIRPKNKTTSTQLSQSSGNLTKKKENSQNLNSSQNTFNQTGGFHGITPKKKLVAEEVKYIALDEITEKSVPKKLTTTNFKALKKSPKSNRMS